LTITNTGPVIALTEISSLLQPFQQMTPARTARGGGVGLSLAIEAAIAAAHGATLNATARSEGGLAVEVVFPSVSDSHQPLATGLAGVTSASGVELL